MDVATAPTDVVVARRRRAATSAPKSRTASAARRRAVAPASVGRVGGAEVLAGVRSVLAAHGGGRSRRMCDGVAAAVRVREAAPQHLIPQ